MTDKGTTNGYPVDQVIDGNLTVADPYNTGAYGHVASGPLVTRHLELVATTGLNGVALVNGTPTILSWTAPNDGKMHRVITFSQLYVSVATTGGQVDASVPLPSGNTSLKGIFSSTLAVGDYPLSQDNWPYSLALIPPNTTFSVVQQSALTAGAAKIWAEIWAS